MERRDLGPVLLVATVALALVGCGGGGDQDARPAAAVEPDSQDEAQALLDDAATALASTPTGTFEGSTEASGVGEGDRLEVSGRFDVDRGLAEVSSQLPGAQGTVSTNTHRYVGDDGYLNSVGSGEFEACWLQQSGTSGSAESLPFLLVLDGARARGLVEGESDQVVAQVSADEALAAALHTGATSADDEITDDLLVDATIVVEDGRYRSVSYDVQDVLRVLDDAGIDPDAVVPLTVDADTLGRTVLTYDELGTAEVGVERPPTDVVASIEPERSASAPECRDFL